MSELKKRILQGIHGEFEGLSNGFNRLNNYLFGIQRKCYYLLGGDSGTYKTTLVDFMVTNALLDAESKNIPIEIFYYSYEIDKITKQCNWLSRVIFQKYGITIPPEVIKGLGKNRLNQEQYEIVVRESDYIERLFDKIQFRFIATNPTGIYNELWGHAEDNGKLTYEKYIDEKGEVRERITGYKSKDENVYRLGVLDHLYHLKKERNFEIKEVIDKYSEYCVALRNIFGYSFINVQQFNDGLT